jgi:aconitate hydratase
MTRKVLSLDGSERFDVTGLAGGIKPLMEVTMSVQRSDGRSERVPLLCRIDTVEEVEYYRSGGILQYVLRRLAAS